MVCHESPANASVTNTSNMTTPIPPPDCIPPYTIMNSLRNIANGGNALNAATAAKSNGPLQGNAEMPPAILPISFVPNLVLKLPAPKKAVPFANPCDTTWSITPASAIGTPKLAPIAMIPICSTLEYANILFISLCTSRNSAAISNENTPNEANTS